MKFSLLPIIPICLFLLAGCSLYGAKPSAPASAVVQPKPLSVPVGKNWQIIEEAPHLSDDRGRLPFQKDQSLQPQGPKPVSPEENRTIDTTR